MSKMSGEGGVEFAQAEYAESETAVFDRLKRLDKGVYAQAIFDSFMTKVWDALDQHNEGIVPDATPYDFVYEPVEFTVDNKIVVVRLSKQLSTGHLRLSANRWGPIIRLDQSAEQFVAEKRQKEKRFQKEEQLRIEQEIIGATNRVNKLEFANLAAYNKHVRLLSELIYRFNELFNLTSGQDDPRIVIADSGYMNILKSEKSAKKKQNFLRMRLVVWQNSRTGFIKLEQTREE